MSMQRTICYAFCGCAEELICASMSRTRSRRQEQNELSPQLNLVSCASIVGITTGTEAEEGIHNLYSQMKFLDWRIIGFKFFTPFRNTYLCYGWFRNATDYSLPKPRFARA